MLQNLTEIERHFQIMSFHDIYLFVSVSLRKSDIQDVHKVLNLLQKFRTSEVLNVDE